MGNSPTSGDDAPPRTFSFHTDDLIDEPLTFEDVDDTPPPAPNGSSRSTGDFPGGDFLGGPDDGPPPPPEDRSWRYYTTPVISPWLKIASWWSRKHSHSHFIYAGTPGGVSWWWYDGRVWHPLATNDPRLLDTICKNRYGLAQQLKNEGDKDAADLLANDREWRWAQASGSDFMVGLRDQLGGLAPEPQLHHCGTPDGVIDLRDGSIQPHAPELRIRGITSGLYLPDDNAAHLEALNRRFGKVFAPDTLDAYLKLLGLSLTGLAQSYRSIVMVVGPSGSGKGDACNVANLALGDRGQAVSSDWIGQKNRSDIDAVTANVLQFQPAIIKVDEVGGDTEVSVSRLMTLTGNSPTQARRPHGPMIHGVVRAQFWTTAVVPPPIPRNSGIERRLAVLPTIRALDPSEIDEMGGHEQVLLNAVVTLAAQKAREVYRPGYLAPAGDAGAKKTTLDEMDPVSSWLESQDELHGQAVKATWIKARSDLGLSERELSQTMFGLKVKNSKRWHRGQLPGGARVILDRGRADIPAAPLGVSFAPEDLVD